MPRPSSQARPYDEQESTRLRPGVRWALAVVVLACVLWAAGSCYYVVQETRSQYLGPGLRH